MKTHIIFVQITLLISNLVLAQTDYSALSYWNYYSDAENTLYKQQCALAFEHLEARQERISKLKTPRDWEDRQTEVKEILQRIVGPFPKKTPLNPVITGKLKGEGFSIEKLYFESLPGYKVTAAFYLPKDKKKSSPRSSTVVDIVIWHSGAMFISM